MRTIIILLLLMTPILGQSQDSEYKFSLDEAIAYALENNYSAINADRDLEDAQKQKWITIASGLPQISGAVSYQNMLKQGETPFPSILIPEKFLPDGFVQGPNIFVPLAFSQPQSMSATATLTQQIFDGSYIVGVQATKTFIQYSQNNKEKSDLEIKKAVAEAYGNVLLANESVIILENNSTALKNNLDEATKIFENGLGDEESVDQLQITLTSVENQLRNATRLKGITLQMLNLLMGLPISTQTELSENLDALTQKQIDFGVMNSDFNIENNIDYKLVKNLNEQRELELKLAKSRALPTLNAFVNYGSSSFSEKFDFFKSEQQWFDSSILGFDLNIPLFSSLGRSANTQRAKIAFEKAKTQMTEAEEQIKLQLESAKSNYILAIEEYENSKQNLGLAKRIENKNQIKYSEGLASSFELRQAQLQLYASQQEYLQSMVNVINSKTTLETIINN